MTELEKRKMLEEKLPSIAKELEGKINEWSSNETKKKHALEIVRQINQITPDDVYIMGSNIVSLNPPLLSISSNELKLEKESEKNRLQFTYKYLEELVEELNEICILEFDFPGICSIGPYIRGEKPECELSFGWKFSTLK